VAASVAAQLADAVTAELNDQVLSGITATRSWLPRVDLKDLDQTRVTVAPRTLARRRESRAEASRQATGLRPAHGRLYCGRAQGARRP